MNSAPLKKAPINWIAIFALVFLPIVALITVPIYSYHHDFSMGAWISMFFLLAVSSLGITAGYHRLWAHRAYEAALPLKILLMIAGTFAVQNSILFGLQVIVLITDTLMMSIKILIRSIMVFGMHTWAGCYVTTLRLNQTIKMHLTY